MKETGKTVIQFQTGAGLLTAHRSDNGITVDMGPAQDLWSDIPLASPTDTLHLPIKEDLYRTRPRSALAILTWSFLSKTPKP